MAKGISSLFKDMEYINFLGQNARRYVNDHFSPMKSADSYADIINNLFKSIGKKEYVAKPNTVATDYIAKLIRERKAQKMTGFMNICHQQMCRTL